MNYEQMSDFEINKRVAELRPYTWIVGDGSCPAVSDSAVSIEYKTFKYGNLISHGVDYCNHPEDAWSIIEEIWPTLMQVCLYDFNVGLGASECSRWEGMTHIHGGNKLRAAMICYLMMQEAE